MQNSFLDARGKEESGSPNTPWSAPSPAPLSSPASLPLVPPSSLHLLCHQLLAATSCSSFNIFCAFIFLFRLPPLVISSPQTTCFSLLQPPVFFLFPPPPFFSIPSSFFRPLFHRLSSTPSPPTPTRSQEHFVTSHYFASLSVCHL